MQIICPACQATIDTNPPKVGRFTPKCPKCQQPFVLTIQVQTVEQAKPNQTEQQLDRAILQKKAQLVQLQEKLHKAETTLALVQAKPSSEFLLHAETADATQLSKVGSRSALPSANDHDLTQPSKLSTGVPKRSADDDHTQAQSYDANASPQEETDLPAPASRVGGYEVLKPLGKGGMGAVFLCRQLSLDRSVALKLMHPNWAKDPIFVSRFIREAYAAAQLTHHNVVQIYELGEDRRSHYFSMEYVDGESLGDLVRSRKRLPVTEAVGYIIQAAKGLKFAHDRGMVHRDIKPDNLMLNSEGLVKVADLGLVKTRGMTARDDATPAIGGFGSIGSALGSLPDVTRAGSAMGSPSYMAPEQCRDATTVDARADQYSLGCTLYAMLAGTPPFTAPTAVDVIAKHLNEPPPDLTTLGLDVPRDLAAIVARTLKKNPDDRYPTMEALIAALQAWQTRAGSAAEPTEEELAKLSGLFKQLDSSPQAKLLKYLLPLGPVAGVLFALILLPVAPVLAGGVVLLTAVATASTFLVNGLATRSAVFSKVREWVFNTRLVDWLTAAVIMVCGVAVLVVLGLHLAAIVAVVLGVAAGYGIAHFLMKPAHEDTLQLRDKIETMTRHFRRKRSMDEDAIRRWVVECAGDRWEQAFELLYDYQAMIQARSTMADITAARPKHRPWRDWLFTKLDEHTQRRKRARTEAVLRKAEAARLKAEGVQEAEALAQAEAAAAELVQEAQSIQRANTETKPKVNVQAMMTRYERAQRDRPKKNSTMLWAKRLLALPWDPRWRLLLAAVLIVFGLLWVRQNMGEELTAVTQSAQQVESSEQATQVAKSAWQSFKPLLLHPEQSAPLRLSWLPANIAGMFHSIVPIFAGLILLLSVFSGNRITIAFLSALALGAFTADSLLSLVPFDLALLANLGMAPGTALATVFGLLAVLLFVMLGRGRR